MIDKTNSMSLKVSGASENNLKNIDVQIPHNSLTVITGLSGSGKSSLAYDVIFKESQRRFLDSFSSYSRQYIGKLEKPKAEKIVGLQPALAINQNSHVANARSTVGTLSGIYDYLRLLYARIGTQLCIVCDSELMHGNTSCNNCNSDNTKLQSKLFSFNSNYGACPECKGLGITEQIDVDKLVANHELSLREGALVPTTPNGYIVYSQVRVDELNKVCNEHGFSVDIPWKQLSKEQRDVILYGSDKIKILFGKHSLESRLKWKGITALPREENFYKGMIPIMEDILRRDRNDNILRFATSYLCKSCQGSRLRKEATSVTIAGKTISDLSNLSLKQLSEHLISLIDLYGSNEIVESTLSNAIKRLNYLSLLGLDYLTLARESTSLSGGESQRIRLASQVGSGLQGILYVLDEPSIGLHPRDNKKLLKVLKSLRDNGNTILVVEHDEEIIKASDYLIDIGPKAGLMGGEVVFQGNTKELFSHKSNYPNSLTASWIKRKLKASQVQNIRKSNDYIRVSNASVHNLQNIDVSFKAKSFNVVTGVSGSGKSTLVHNVLGKSLRGKSQSSSNIVATIPINRIIEIDQSPIGRTPRSNPATYTNIFDHIREIYSKQPESVKRGYNKGRFSFNNKGGRCDICEGSGYIELGMHFLGNVEVTCEKCNGTRYNDETLEIVYKNKNISQVLDLSIVEALDFFSDFPSITKILKQLIKLDVGYLKLGQSSTTLSGGEAQRVKLASELHKTSLGHNIYILDEPSLGLHKADISLLLRALNEIVDSGNTVIVIEHDLDIISQADHIIDLGPEGGELGGNLVIQGTPKDVMGCKKSHTGKALKERTIENEYSNYEPSVTQGSNITFKGVTTNNLKNVNIEIPLNKTTVITGVSGSGKTSLAFDTIFSESRNRFTENLSSYARRMMSKVKKPELEECSGLTPAIAIRQNRFGKNPRSTVGTQSDIYDLYRLLFSRFGIDNQGNPTNLPLSMFSFNNYEAVCPHCKGLGIVVKADPSKFITDSSLPITNGAMDGTKPGKFFGDRHGQYVVTLLEAGKIVGIDFEVPYCELDNKSKDIVLNGTGEVEYSVSWKFRRGKREGTHNLTTTWNGFANYLEEDYLLKKDGARADIFLPIISDYHCEHCKGNRYKDEINQVTFEGLNLGQLAKLSVQQSLVFFIGIRTRNQKSNDYKSDSTIAQIIGKLQVINDIGLGYLSVNRSTSSLSGGEAQRLRIANQLGSSLCGLTYILDEPTVGLHPYDTENLIETLNQVKNNGNTIIMVEHDMEVIKGADSVIDMGPGAGKNGGIIVAQGSPDDIISNPKSITGKYLSGSKSYINTEIKAFETGIEISSAMANNLKNLDIKIPKQVITSITGISGSGKSSLVFDVIGDSFKAGSHVNCGGIKFNGIDNIVEITQQKIGISSNSNIATYTGIFDEIRSEFAKQKLSKELGFKKSYFSFNNKQGTCSTCKGMGNIKVPMDFLSDVWVVCDECNGRRYKEEVLQVKIDSMSIYDVLNLEVNEALDFFHDHTKVLPTLKLLKEVGLGYLILGQPTSTLSGGETQRLKLASELIHAVYNNTLFIFDEPSTGLHNQDVEKLISIFRKLVDAGNTVLIVEHNLEIIRNSDYIIDLGPKGGELGGEVIYSGSILDMVQSKESYTARALYQNSIP